MLLPRLVAGLVGLALLGCEASPPAAQTKPSTEPSAQGPGQTQGPTPAVDVASPAVEPEGPPPPPPLPTAAGLAYREVLIGTTDGDQPLPMIVAIHGLGDNPDNFRHVLDGFYEDARLILPRGLEPTEGDGDGWSWFPRRARDPDVAALSEGIAAAADRIAAGLEQLQRDRPTVGRPIVTGFSQGGMLTFTLAVAHPEVVGHAVAIGGWLPPPLMPAKGTEGTEYPAIDALHGTDDRAVAYEPTQLSVQTLDERGFEVELTTYEGVGHMITPQMRRDLFDRLTDAIRAERRRKPSREPSQ